MEHRKSYRRAFVRKDQGYVPYRRSQDALEGKIVGIINKLVHRKSCYKELSHLADKMSKLTTKEMMNKYIVSGFSVIIKLITSEGLNELYEESLI